MMVFACVLRVFPTVALVSVVGAAQAGEERKLEWHASWSSEERAAIERVDSVCNDAVEKMLKAVEDDDFPGDSILAGFCSGGRKGDRGGFMEGVNRMWKKTMIRMFSAPMLQMIKQTARTGDATCVDKDGFSLLHVAVLIGDHALAKSLVERGADVNRQVRPQARLGVELDVEGDTPLSCAICPTPFFLLMNDAVGFDADERLDMVAFLLDHGADVNKVCTVGMTPLEVSLMWTYMKPECAAVAGLLLDRGARTEVEKEGYVFSALHAAVLAGSLPLVEKMYGMGMDVNKSVRTRGSNCEGAPLLCVAWRKESAPAVLRFLLDHGADPDARYVAVVSSEDDPEVRVAPYAGYTLLMELCRNVVHVSLEEDDAGRERWLELARILLEKGASPDAAGAIDGQTALLICCRHIAGSAKAPRCRELAVRMARLLLDHGALPFSMTDGRSKAMMKVLVKEFPSDVRARLPELFVIDSGK